MDRIAARRRGAAMFPYVVVMAVVASIVQAVGPGRADAAPAGHDDAYVYRLPYADGASFPVLQAYGSRFSHRGAEHYTVDFRMAEGTPVLSARDGVVTEVQGTHRTACWAEGCGPLGNHVVVRHDDNSIAMYFHLAPDSVMVVPGQSVQRGQQLAGSGNTGLTTTPHLHFGVYVFVRDGVMQSIPIRFATSSGAIELRQGHRYRHPDAPPSLASERAGPAVIDETVRSL
jgi:murein DD-endopeptidase MepM/ murein hydrolase activator NlpD